MFAPALRKPKLVGGIPSDQAAYRDPDNSVNLIPIPSLGVKGPGQEASGGTRPCRCWRERQHHSKAEGEALVSSELAPPSETP
jgi:hypothetical protein